MKHKVSNFPLAELQKHVSYNPETGVFTRLICHKRALKGAVAGYLIPQGYWHIQLKGQVFSQHRLAWFFTHGCWPLGDIDHANGIRSDNRIANLREATRSQNLINFECRKDSKSGIRGVYLHKITGKWAASCGYEGKQKHIGIFETKEAAAHAYREFATAIYGDFCHPINRGRAA